MDATSIGTASPFVLAILGVMATIAYKHPKAYARIWPWISLGTFLIFIGFAVWNCAIWKSESAALVALSNANVLTSVNLTSEMGKNEVPGILWVSNCVITVWGLILNTLPSWLLNEHTSS